jgi:hypothetical protein
VEVGICHIVISMYPNYLLDSVLELVVSTVVDFGFEKKLSSEY